jgi:predicted DNA-binding antitoxin AbrB/MazE fold protein
MVSVRAVYHQGHLQLLDPVNLVEGQQVEIQIVEAEHPLKDLIADMLTPFEGIASEADESALLQELDQQLQGKRPLSEIIIEDR